MILRVPAKGVGRPQCMASIPVPTHRTRLAWEKGLPGGSPPPLPGHTPSPGQNGAVHSHATNLTCGTYLSGMAASPPRTCEIQGVISKEPRPTSTQGCREHAGRTRLQSLPAAPPGPMLTLSPFPPDLLRTGFLMRDVWIAANICKASFRLTVLLPHNILGTRGGRGRGTDSQSVGRKSELGEDKNTCPR